MLTLNRGREVAIDIRRHAPYLPRREAAAPWLGRRRYCHRARRRRIYPDLCIQCLDGDARAVLRLLVVAGKCVTDRIDQRRNAV